MATTSTTTIHVIRQKRYTLRTMTPIWFFTVRPCNFRSRASICEWLLYRLAYQNGVKSTGLGRNSDIWRGLLATRGSRYGAKRRLSDHEQMLDDRSQGEGGQKRHGARR